MLASLKRFFATTEGSIQGFLSMEELYRSILTSLGSGTLIGVLILVIQGLLSHVAIVFPNPAVASLATVILTMILDLLRRQARGRHRSRPLSRHQRSPPPHSPACSEAIGRSEGTGREGNSLGCSPFRFILADYSTSIVAKSLK